MNTELFYQNLPHFSSFKGITNRTNFVSVPKDWKVIITDVKGSMTAIESGRYKDVNTIGAATIVAAQKGMGHIDFPFVFGGDGATLVVPPHKVDSVVKELLALRRLSEMRFKLGLRVGVVDVDELIHEGSEIKVAKFELTAEKCIAIFKGGGLNLAETKVKNEEQRYGANDQGFELADLTGLSCRWNPIPNKRGKIVSLLVESRIESDDETYEKFLHKLDEIFDGEVESANPVNIDQAKYKSIGECFRNEMRYHKSILSLGFLQRFVEILATVIIFKLKIPPLVFNPAQYTHSMRTHSDYRKFDDMLRMTIDCSDQQITQIREYLQQKYLAGSVFYGIHESTKSLMTCYVNGLEDGHHIHFIDSDDGGYAMAAKQLKEQRHADRKKRAEVGKEIHSSKAS